MWLFRPSGTVPYSAAQNTADIVENLGPVIATADLITVAMVAVCVTGMVLKFRRSSGVERQQLRLVVWGAGVAGGLAVLLVVADLLASINPRWPALVMTVVLTGSYGVAIAKYRPLRHRRRHLPDLCLRLTCHLHHRGLRRDRRRRGASLRHPGCAERPGSGWSPQSSLP